MSEGVRIRLSTEGAAEVVNTFAQIGQAGESAAARLGDSFDKQGRAVEDQAEKVAAAIAKMTAVELSPELVTEARQMIAEVEQEAEKAGEVFSKMFAVEVDPQMREALRAAMDEAQEGFEAAGENAGAYALVLQRLEDRYDKVAVVQRDYASALADIAELLDAKVISESEAQRLTELATNAVIEQAEALKQQAEMSGQARQGYRSLGSSISQFIQDLARGTNPVEAFGRRVNDLGSAGQRVLGQKKDLAAFLTGPWGVAISAGAALLGVLIGKYMSSREEAEKATKATIDFGNANVEIARFVDLLTGRIILQNQVLRENAILKREGEIDQARKRVREIRGEITTELRARMFNGNLTEGEIVNPLLGRTVTERGQGALDPDLQAILRQGGGIRDLDRALGELAQRRPELRDLRVQVSNLAAEAENLYRGSQERRAEIGLLREEPGALQRYNELTGKGRDAINRTMLDAQARLTGALKESERAQARLTLVREEAWQQLQRGIISEDEYTSRVAAAERAVNEAQAAERGRGRSREESLRRQAEAMEVNTAGAIALANAYLQGGEAAMRAEAMRKGATDATRRGISVEQQIRRQLNLDIAEGVVGGAKAVAQLRDEIEARADVNERIASTNAVYPSLQQALEEELAIRPLIRLQALAQGDAYAALTRVIEAYRGAMADARREEARSGAIEAAKALGARTADMRALIGLAGDPERQALELARRQAAEEARRAGWSAEDRDHHVELRVEEARLDIALQRADLVARLNRDHEESMALARRELELVAANDNQRQSSLRLLELELRLNRDLGPEYADQIAGILAKAEAMEEMNRRITEQAANWDELRSTGANFVDTVLNVDNWKDWGSMGKRILNDLISDFVRLGAANPLKNMLFGSNLPTLQGVLGAVRGGGLQGAVRGMMAANPGAFALGTLHAPGGMALVGENGAELMEVPRGARVRTAADTRRMMAGGSALPPVSLYMPISADGADPAQLAALTAEVRQLKEELPSRIVAVWSDARDRNLIRTAA
ncbi:MAG: hypothetical protein ACK4K7_03035 [Allosphingosinicella sp.]|uniref:hypothetical protein n=1 Tax=Allosphingosinicella sp. TaxID=2823234 RepID=UPI00393B37C0